MTKSRSDDMDLLKNIDKWVNNRNLLLALLDVLFLIAPGLMVILVFRGDLIANLDWIKLSLLSISITTSLSFWNAMVMDTWDERLGPKGKSEFFYLLSVSIIVSGLVMDTTLLLGHLFGKGFDWDLQIFAWIEGILALSAAYKGVQRHRKEKQKVNTNAHAKGRSGKGTR